MRRMTFVRSFGALCLSALYGVIALLLGGRSVAQCLGLDNTACVAAWYASMSQVDQAIHDAPWWALPMAIFAALWAVTLTVAVLRRWIRSRGIRAR